MNRAVLQRGNVGSDRIGVGIPLRLSGKAVLCGEIAEEEVEYLMSRGLTRDEATAMIVRGFLKVEIEGLPPMLEAELKKAIEDSEEDLF